LNTFILTSAFSSGDVNIVAMTLSPFFLLADGGGTSNDAMVVADGEGGDTLVGAMDEVVEEASGKLEATKRGSRVGESLMLACC